MATTERITLQVTSEDIENARKELTGKVDALHVHACPVSQALRRRYGKVYGVGIKHIYRRDDDKVRTPLPGPVREFITRFDNGLLVNPGVFEIEVPL